MEPPSTRPWLGVEAALSAVLAAGGCFCASLVTALIAGSDPGVVYEQHRWLGAVVAASAVCAYVAMMGWATLRHGGLPAPVLLMALALAGAPFSLPGRLFVPAAAAAVVGCAALATVGVRHPPASPEGTRVAAAALTVAAVVMTVAQAVAVGQVGAIRPPRAEVLAEGPKASAGEAREKDAAPARAGKKPHETEPPARPGGKDAAPASAPEASSPAPAGKDSAPEASSPVTPGGTDAARAPDVTPPAAVAPGTPGTPAPPEAAPAPDAGPLTAAARQFVRDYYAALDAHDFKAAWRMLTPDVQSAFGGFGPWRKGYARTISHATGGVTVTVAGTGAIVGLTLRAGDRGTCGRVAQRRFAVTWRLARTDAGLRATAASARKLSGPEPC